MGTPEEQVFLNEINFGERLRLLQKAADIGRRLGLKDLAELLEELKSVIWPLVQWLDKPVWRGQLADFPTSAKFKKARGLFLLRRPGAIVWLQRSGQWLVWDDFGPRETYHKYLEFDSAGLAQLILENPKMFFSRSYNREKVFLQEVECLREAAVYNDLVLRLLGECFERIDKELKNREARYATIRQRLAVLGDFARALDPLACQPNKVKLPYFSIDYYGGKGVHRVASNYFSAEALKPFWEAISQSSQSGHREKTDYKQCESCVPMDSLKRLLGCVCNDVEEVGTAKKHGKETPEDLLSFNSGRLPLIKKEREVLAQIADSIKQED